MTDRATQGLHFAPFGALDAATLHDALKLRFDVFVLEQRSLYPEIDGADPGALHGLMREGGELVGVLRILGLDSDGEVRLGRIAVRRDRRHAGLGARMIREALAALAAHAPGRPVLIAAQAHLEGYYRRFGFLRTSDEFDDGGVPHVEMTLAPPAVAGCAPAGAP